MDSLLRGTVVYLFLLLVFRAAGKRTLSETTTFDLVLLLIISETTQEAMLDSDHSITNAFLLIISLVGIDVLFSWLKLRVKWLRDVLDPSPVILLEDGAVNEKRMRRSRVAISDILSSARSLHGIERLDQIKYAILEQGGHISIVPRPNT